MIAPEPPPQVRGTKAFGNMDPQDHVVVQGTLTGMQNQLRQAAGPTPSRLPPIHFATKAQLGNVMQLHHNVCRENEEHVKDVLD